MPGAAEAGLDAYLGDLAISVPRAAEQATAGGHSLTAELQLLTVHGVLHLLDHDHADDAEKQTMWTAQAAILEKLGAEITAPAVE
jgi:probable rRNA maturation factor